MDSFAQEVRKAIGKNPGDTVHVVFKKDDAPRSVEIPEDMANLLSCSKTIKQFFDELSYTHQREYVTWITSTKNRNQRKKTKEVY